MKYLNWRVPTEEPVIEPSFLKAGCTPLLAAILHLRGLTEDSAARSFLRGGAELLRDPLALTDMLPAVERLTRS